MAEFFRDHSAGPKACITGVGLATPLGASAADTWEAILAGRFITNHSRAIGPREHPRGRVMALALHVARQAISEAQWGNSVLAADETALLIGTSKGPVESWLTAESSLTPLLDMELAPYLVGRLHPTGLAEIATLVAGELRLGCGPRITISAACASGLGALVRAALMIQSGEAHRALVTAVESSLHPLFLGSFRRLGVLPREGIGCRPFDQARDGFLMSEAAAAVCLERLDCVDAGLAMPQIIIDRFALGSDAQTLTAGDPTGRVVRRMLSDVIAGRRVDLIHAHATGTDQDAVELSAIEHVSAEHSTMPILYSHKGALGHSLGAAGLISVILNVLSHRSGTVAGNVTTPNPLPHERVILSASPVRRRIDCSIAHASGFGGPSAAICLKNA